MRPTSLDVRVLLTSSSRRMYDELCEKILQHNIFCNQQWVSNQRYRIGFGQPSSAHSAPPQATTMLFTFTKQFEGSASWAHLSPMPLPRYFWLPRGPFCCCYKPVAPLLEPHQQQGGFWLPRPKPALLLMPHTDEGAEVHGYVPRRPSTDPQRYSTKTCTFYCPFSTKGKILALCSLSI